jgi:predicted anti-sigma-YlaC factor YlaD
LAVAVHFCGVMIASRFSIPFAITLLAAVSGGCSVKRIAINQFGNALAGGGATFASDDDAEFVRDAVPFSLKLMESLLAESPKHRGLLLATASGFTQYAYAYLQEDADELEDTDPDRSKELRTRARRMYFRARDYGIRGLETRYPEFGRQLKANPQAAVGVTKKADAALLYWTAAAWGAAISNSKEYPAIIADQPIVEALIDRVTQLDESFGDGSVHTFLIAYEGSRPGGTGNPEVRAREHFARAVQLSKGMEAGPLVSLAENVSVGRQDRKEFTALLNQALAIDPDARPEVRLENLVMQRRARWLLERTNKLFLD